MHQLTKQLFNNLDLTKGCMKKCPLWQSKYSTSGKSTSKTSTSDN